MKIVQYNSPSNGRPWDSAPGYHRIALLNKGVRYTNFSRLSTGYSNGWAENGVGHLTNFRLELIF